jgi:hypothetical protein
LSDNAKEFNSELCDELLKFAGIKHVKIMPYAHQENSIIERSNKEIIRFLKGIIYDKFISENWKDYLPLV